MPVEDSIFSSVRSSTQLPEPVGYVMGQFDIPPSETCALDTIQESLSSWAAHSDGKLISN